MERDKLLHFIVCEVMVMLIVVACLAVGVGGWAFAIAPAATMAVGVAKELKDMKTTGFDKWDLVADFLGTAAGLGLILMGVLSTL